MASREKKIVISKKQSASPVPPKDGSAVSETTKLTVSKTELIQTDDAAQKTAAVKSSPISKTNAKAVTIKPFPKKVGRKPLNKNLGINLKTNEKKPGKIKQKIAQALLNNAKNNLESKKPLLKNGIKPKRMGKRKLKLEIVKRKVGRPRLIPLVYSLEENTEKKPRKKRMKKIRDANDDTKKCKVPNTTNYSSIDDTINSILSQITVEEDEKVKPKLKKAKIDPSTESIEDVMNDLTYLIKNEDIKQEVDVLEPKTEVVKTKKAMRKPKVDLLKKRAIKKEVLDNITIDASAKHLIDMLDLSVSKTDQLSLPVCNRRHSIEKFSIDANSTELFNVFSSLPRAPTSRSKRSSKVRQSVDSTASLKKNPYSTRSDAPILRNGKHRKLKDSLLDGLEYKKRKRLCSDFSGSEKSVSKLSGYESDSSFTDTTSFPCSDSMDQKDEQSKIDVKKEIPLALGPNTQNEIDVNNLDSKVNDTCIFETDLSSVVPLNGCVEDRLKNENVMDDNSNVCDEVLSEVPTLTDALQVTNLYEDVHDSDITDDSVKVPEKSIILDKMKETFNDVNSEDLDKRTTRESLKKTTLPEDELHVSASTFYGNKDNIDNECDNSVEQNISSNNKKEEETVEISTGNEPENKSNLELANSDTNISDEKSDVQVEETAENLAVKRDILQALGLQSLKAAEEAKLKEKSVKNDYTGTLKTVIKLNRFEKKKGRPSFKMTLQKKTKFKENDMELNAAEDENGQKTLKEIASSSWRSHGAQSSDTAGALRKSHYFNRSNNMDGSSEHTSDGDGAAADGEESGIALVIPEKASSFSVHPGRLCKDECSYCFGKFGLFDTPCHIAQMKSVDRQDKILQNEKHLTRDSCLCDACYRHVDRKSNTPSYLNKGSKRNSIIAPGPRQNHCHVLGCGGIATNILRRKWLIKMRKSVREVINIDLENPGLHSIPICTEHYIAVEHLMVCAVCKRKLARNHIHYLGPEMNELNTALNEEGIPVKLIDKPVVCKLCRYFSSLVMKPIEERPENTSEFFKEYKTRLLNIYDTELTEEPAQDSELVKQKVEKVPTRRKKKKALVNGEQPVTKSEFDKDSNLKAPRSVSNTKRSSKSRSESPSDYMVDYNTLIPSIAMDCGSDIESLKYETTIIPVVKPLSEGMPQETSENSSPKSKNKNSCSNKTCATAVQRLGSNPCISVRQLFPGEEDVGLQGHVEFGNVKEKTPEGWEKCCSTIQYDNDTKLLWQELQKPYGNQSSFLRHLILLEKYFRSGDLVLSPNASHHSINYSESVQNRLRAYDNIPLNSSVKKSNSGIVTTKLLTPSVSIINAANIPKNTPITISQISNMTPSSNKTKNPGVPPGLISLHPGTSRPVAPSLIKVPQPQKIKIPLTKNWRPNLMPIDPSKGDKEKKPGYVKVMSGGKPYHITMDDYNRMCAIKKSYDLKQKRLLEAQNNSSGNQSNYLKPLLPRKGLVISKSSTITSPKSDHSITDTTEVENSLEKLDKTVENLESKLSESTTMLLPKIPKSLTVIPQTVTHKSPEMSSSNLVTSKPKSASTKS